MRFYPRQSKSRADSLAGPGHIGNHSQPDKAGALDRLTRYRTATDSTNILAAYGGAA